MDTSHPILLKPIREIFSSDEFLEMAEYNHFVSLQQIIQYPVHELLALPKFDHRMLYELISILKSYGLDSLLKEF